MIDYMVMEAVALKVRKLDDKAAQDQKRKQEVEEARKRLKEQFQ